MAQRGRLIQNVKQSLTHTEYVRLKTLGIIGLEESSIDPRVLANQYLFVNDINQVKQERLEEYVNWYLGDSDRLKNYYTRANAIDYNLDPLYNENKKSYFWSVSSTEKDIKRTHSAHARDIVDTLVRIMSLPNISDTDKTVDTVLKKILKVNRFNQTLAQVARPMTLVEGWGAWKINWDTTLSDYPIILYYRADRVDFIWNSNHILRAIIYKDFFQNEKGESFVLYETRRLAYSPETKVTDLHIEKELYKLNDTEYMTPVPLLTLPQLKDVEPHVKISNFKRFLGYPNIFYYDVSEEFYGRSIYTGKLDLLDDLDQCHSQDANAVRRSTVHEYFNKLYLETDTETGIPIQPDAFDRKYIKFEGAKDADGSTQGTNPVQVVQPQINFDQYSAKEREILLNIISGLLSPATMGIDIAKKDNASDTREKEKITIFTRNDLLDSEEDIMRNIANDALVANELMHLKLGEQITCKEYENLSVQYGEFANESFEAKLETVQTGWQGGLISDEMAVDMLYGTSLSAEKKKKELKYIKQTKKESQNPPNAPEEQGDFGDLGGNNDNPFNDEHEKARINDLQQDMGIPELGGFDSYDHEERNKKRLDEEM